jgi:8-oxo-dGTP pyrophosphatase MutT (NUDIX family)
VKTITFDFDNTIAMSYVDTSGEHGVPVFQEYNLKIIDKIKENIKQGNNVYLVTSRKKDSEKYFPEQSIPYHLKQLGLDEYFLPDRLYYTNGESKYPTLLKLGTEMHYDDDIEEHNDAQDHEYEVKQPLDGFEDSNIVGKVIIFDELDHILILQRSDEGHLWDLPGGHVKHIELSRHPDGLKDGTEREIYEETGLFMPFLKEFLEYDFKWKESLYQINIYLSKITARQPFVRLDLQDHIENIDYRWIKLENLEDLYSEGECTGNLRKAYEELSYKDQIFEQSEVYQRSIRKKHRKMKKRLIGLGKNKHFGGGKGHKRPQMSRSKSAPAGFGMMEEEKWPKEFFRERKMEENDEKSKKKVKIKVKITHNLDEKRKKRKKRRKKRKKSNKTYNKGAYWPYFGGHYGTNNTDFGSEGGDGGE